MIKLKTISSSNFDQQNCLNYKFCVKDFPFYLQNRHNTKCVTLIESIVILRRIQVLFGRIVKLNSFTFDDSVIVIQLIHGNNLKIISLSYIIF